VECRIVRTLRLGVAEVNQEAVSAGAHPPRSTRAARGLTSGDRLSTHGTVRACCARGVAHLLGPCQGGDVVCPTPWLRRRCAFRLFARPRQKGLQALRLPSRVPMSQDGTGTTHMKDGSWKHESQTRAPGDGHTLAEAHRSCRAIPGTNGFDVCHAYDDTAIRPRLTSRPGGTFPLVWPPFRERLHRTGR
jgi:hypothetical protein